MAENNRSVFSQGSRSQTSQLRCWHDHAPPAGSKGGSSLPPPASGAKWPQAFLGLELHPSTLPLSLCGFLPCVCLLGHWSLDFAPILTLGCSLPNDPKLSYICKDPSPNEVTGSGDQDLDRRLGEPHFNPLQPCNIQYVPVKKGVSHRYFEAL